MIEIKEKDFACSCGNDNKFKCDAVREWAMDFLGATPKDFLTKWVYAMHWNYGADLGRIGNDMWSGIKIDHWWPPKGEEPLNVYMQCDSVEDGLAFVLYVFHQKYGKFIKRTNEDDEGPEILVGDADGKLQEKEA